MKESKFYFFILSAALMLLVLSAAIAFPILFRPFYYAHIAALDLPGRTGWSAAEIRNAYNEMLDYCILGAPFGTGVPVSYTHLDVYKRQTMYRSFPV